LLSEHQFESRWGKEIIRWPLPEIEQWENEGGRFA